MKQHLVRSRERLKHLCFRMSDTPLAILIAGLAGAALPA